ncbi:glycosyltransferase family 4 protein [Sporosarcina sp. YIM B06819]|uniref:glycosyltransferase family 4 protein n=1 Tax=Sporosarcina sp. YIM B06819 TaxID=3081769 RepID=UPI00298CE853|nr:glycosyltransferase family 4 protein [Sporosarcina sp. YIM B06819]
MKIVQVITRMDTIGGAQLHVRDLCIALAEEGHSVYVVTGGNLTLYEELNTVYCQSLMRNLNVVADIKAFLELRSILKSMQPDVIATHSSKAGVIGRLVGWSLRIPTLFTAHGWSFTEGVAGKKKRMYRMIERLMGRMTKGVITVSEYDKQLALKHKVLPLEKLLTIHNGVHETELSRDYRHPDNRLTMVMVARFAPPKQQLDLLKALTKLQQFEWEMLFAGDGPLLREAQCFVESEGLNDRVQFLGNRHDISAILQMSDIFLLLSDWEGLPLSILEAMQCSLPVIASDVGGINEAVKHSVNGYLISPKEEAELVDKLAVLLTSPSLRRQMGEHSRLLYEQHFTFEQMHDKTFAYYEKIIEQS